MRLVARAVEEKYVDYHPWYHALFVRSMETTYEKQSVLFGDIVERETVRYRCTACKYERLVSRTWFTPCPPPEHYNCRSVVIPIFKKRKDAK